MNKKLEIKINYQCNNNCVFCLNKHLKKLEFKNLFLKKSIINFVKNGGKDLVISGGEPIIAKDFGEMVSFAKENKIEKIEIHTNGRILYYEKIVKYLKNLEPIILLVSFHFVTPELYKKYSRTDGFSQVVIGLKNIIKYKINHNINIVVMKQNISYLEETVLFLRKIGVKNFQFNFINERNILDDYKKFVPTYTKCAEILEEIVKNNEDMIIKIIDFPFCVLKKNSREKAQTRQIFKRKKTLVYPEKIKKISEVKIKEFLPSCQSCIFRKDCPGVSKYYLYFYGDKEISPISKNSF
jgi:molybdenum cofactor biosynthesis enzyme MoaA